MAKVAPLGASIVGAYAVRSLIIVAFMAVAFRVLGKREMAQLNLYDLAMLMAVSNAVQNAMTGGRGNLEVGIATSSTVILAAFALTRLLVRWPALEKRIIGTPTLLVHEGTLLRDRMRRNRVTQEEIEAACREHGLADPAEAKSLVLEVDGSLTVIPRPPGQRRAPDNADGQPRRGLDL